MQTLRSWLINVSALCM